jgi:hypothetical protein
MALVGAGLDSIADLMPYSDPKQWIVAGLVLMGLAHGTNLRRLVNLNVGR